MSRIKPDRFWNGDPDIEIVEAAGELYALYGWNGEVFGDCWKCKDKYTPADDDHKYTLRPVYRFEVEEIDMDNVPDDSDDWNYATEIVDYDVIF